MSKRLLFLLVLLTLCATSFAAAQTPFTDVTGALGINRAAPIPGDHHGPGALFVDLDGDGFPEIYICRGDPLGGPVPIRNELYLNVPGPGGRVYQLLTNTGAEDGGDSTGAIAADYDNDGDVDIYVINFDSPNTLLQNQLAQGGGLTFVDVTLATDPTFGVSDGQFGVGWAIDPVSGILLDNTLSASFFDANRDGFVDLFVGNHNGYNAGPVFVTIEGPDPRPGRRDVFYLNNGNGTFTDVTTTMPGTPLTGFETPPPITGITPSQRYSSTNAVVAFDANNDTWPDLYVTNKVAGATDADMLYLNQGMVGGVWQGFQNGSYGAGTNFATASPAAMGVAVGDWNNDLIFDAYVTDVGPNELHTAVSLSGGQPSYITFSNPPTSGLFAWGAEWFDFDNDSRVDLYVGNNSPVGQSNTDHLFWNLPNGIFEVSQQAGIQPLTQSNDTRAVVTADYNKDGWVDVLTVPMVRGLITVLQNNVGAIVPQNNWLHLKLVGNTGGPGPLRSTADAIGARAYVSADFDGDGTVLDTETIMREVVSGSSNAGSTSSLILEYGTGLGQRASIRIQWLSGATSSFTNVATNQCITINEVGGIGPPC